jgi:hypothetical protein
VKLGDMADDVIEGAPTELVGHDGQHVVWDRYIGEHVSR